MKVIYFITTMTVILVGFLSVQVTHSATMPTLLNLDRIPPPDLSAAKGVTDSLLILGGPGSLSGKFQDGAGLPDRQGWTGIDLNQPTEHHWQVSTFNATDLDPLTPDNHAWWCGDNFSACNGEDPVEGYGDSWIQYLDWFGTVPDPGSSVTVHIQAMISYDTEPVEDYVFLQVNNSEFMEDLSIFNSQAAAEIVDITTVLTPDYFVGDQGDQVHLRWSFQSDGAWSDEDCRFPSRGAVQLDLIQVHFDQGGGEIQIGTTETCEVGDPLQWQPALPSGPGNFSQVWAQLDDADPDADNYTPQFAFIDDGIVLPGTGGYPCTSYCYGPGGYIVNPERGLSDLYHYLHNEIWSPVIPVPAGGWDGAVFSFDQYVHAELNNGGAYVLGVWHVRSTDDPAGLTGWSDWRDRNIVLWGDPRYIREEQNVTDLLVPGFTHVQLALGAMNYIQYSASTDGTPAPYYDNVAFKVYKNVGPSSLLVRADGSGDYPTIQAAIYAAAPQDTVLLADGVFTGEGNVDLLFAGKEIVVCSASGKPENCIIDLEGSTGDPHRGVSFSFQEGAGSIFSGITITGGYLDQTSGSFTYSGGAITCRAGSSPTITNCIFTDNHVVGTDQIGGAIACNGASPTISDCIFDGNEAVRGGGIGVIGASSPQISNCLFVGNQALTVASGVYGSGSEVNLTLSSCTFYANISPAASANLVSRSNARMDIDHTIVAFGTDGYAVASTSELDLQFSCSNIYGNTGADWYGYISSQLGSNGNISLDPMFCLGINPTLPYGLDEDSPCLPAFNPSCGLIGYYPEGCGQWSPTGDLPPGPERARLLPCFPNPFNPQTTVSFHLPAPALVQLQVFSLDGRLIANLASQVMPTGMHQVDWNGRDELGREVASGVFFCRMKAGSDEDSIRMVLLK